MSPSFFFHPIRVIDFTLSTRKRANIFGVDGHIRNRAAAAKCRKKRLDAIEGLEIVISTPLLSHFLVLFGIIWCFLSPCIPCIRCRR